MKTRPLNRCIAALALALPACLLSLAPSATGGSQAQYLSELELEIWDDPDFKRRFIESYLSETDIEPAISLEERELLFKVFEILREEDELSEEDAKDPEKVEAFEKQLKERQKLREELKITMDTNNDGVDETPFEVALFVINEYMGTIEKKDSISAMLHFFMANLYMQQGANIELPERGENESDEDYKSREAAAQSQKSAKFGQAVTEYNTAVRKHPKFRRAWMNLGKLQVRQKQFDEARKAFVRVIELGGGDSDTYGLLGYCYSSLEQHLPAESAYRMANLLKPEDNNWKMGLVRSFFMQERYASVTAMTGQMIKKDPGNAELWKLQANAYVGLGQPMKAAENFEVVDGMGASTVPTMTLLANIYTNQGLHETAVSAYVRALEMAREDDKKAKGQPDRESLKSTGLLKQMLRGAKVLASQGAYVPTKTMISEVDRIMGDDIDEKQKSEWLKVRARVAVSEGSTGDEIKVLKQIVELDPLDGEALILLGKASAREQDVEQAVFYFKRAAGIEGFEAQAKIEHARVLAKERRYPEAIKLLKDADQIESNEKVREFIKALEQASRSS